MKPVSPSSETCLLVHGVEIITQKQVVLFFKNFSFNICALITCYTAGSSGGLDTILNSNEHKYLHAPQLLKCVKNASDLLTGIGPANTNMVCHLHSCLKEMQHFS